MVAGIVTSEQVQKKYYVYAYAYPDERIFYIGKGQGNRINAHETEARNPKYKSHKVSTIRQIWANGGQIIKRKIAFFENEDDALMYEIASVFLMPQLTNKTIGGRGGTGYRHTEEERAKRSLRYSGRIFSDVTRQLMSAAAQKRVAEGHIFSLAEYCKDKPLTDEQRQKLSKSGKGKPKSEEHKQNISKGQKGKVISEASIRKMKEARKGKKLSEEHKRKIGEAVKKGGKSHPEGQRRKMSVIATQRTRNALGHFISDNQS